MSALERLRAAAAQGDQQKHSLQPAVKPEVKPAPTREYQNQGSDRLQPVVEQKKEGTHTLSALKNNQYSHDFIESISKDDFLPESIRTAANKVNEGEPPSNLLQMLRNEIQISNDTITVEVLYSCVLYTVMHAFVYKSLVGATVRILYDNYTFTSEQLDVEEYLRSLKSMFLDTIKNNTKTTIVPGFASNIVGQVYSGIAFLSEGTYNKKKSRVFENQEYKRPEIPFYSIDDTTPMNLYAISSKFKDAILEQLDPSVMKPREMKTPILTKKTLVIYLSIFTILTVNKYFELVKKHVESRTKITESLLDFIIGKIPIPNVKLGGFIINKIPESKQNGRRGGKSFKKRKQSQRRLRKNNRRTRNRH